MGFLLVFGLFFFLASRPAIAFEFFKKEDVIKKSVFFSEVPHSTLRFVTYNMGYASGDKNLKGSILQKREISENLDQMVEILEEIQPDFLGVQEVDFFARRSFFINQMEQLGHALGFPYWAYAQTWNTTYVPWPYFPIKKHFGRLVSGQVFFSRFPILSQNVHRFQKPKTYPFWYNRFYLDRLVQELVLDINGNKIQIWHVHLEAFNTQARILQSQILGQKVKESPYSSLCVMGDFNSVSRSAANLQAEELETLEKEGLSQFQNGLDLINAEEGEDLYTFPSWKPYKKVDHIFYSSKIRCVALGCREGITASDHLPFWADLELF